MITCPHCGSSHIYRGTSEILHPDDIEWLDKHFDNCPEFGKSG